MTQKYRILLVHITYLAIALGLTGCGGEKAPKPAGIAGLKAGVTGISSEESRASVSQTIAVLENAKRLEPFFANSFGCAIFPTIGKGGVGIGGAFGKGYVFRMGEFTGTSSMVQVTVGFQWGGQAYSQIVFFEDEKAFNNFTSGNFEFGAQASAVAITAGASAQASTGGGASASAGRSQSESYYEGGMAIFTRSKGGLMYEATIGGQKFGHTPIK